MRRLIRLGDWTQVDARPDCAVVTPNENAAITLGAPHTSLEHLARSILDEERIAHPLIVQRFLRKAVEEVLDSTDPQGVARTLLPPIRELFRDGAELGSDPGSERARRVFRVAQAYHSRLRTQGLVDPAEALWEAATVPPPRQPVLVWGYPRLGRDEVAFVDAIAADDSVVYLPYADDHLFGENVATAEALQQRAWTVDRDPAPKVWEVRAHVEADEYAHFEAEVRGNLTQIKALLVDGVPADDIVLVARDDAFYGPTVLSVAREYGVPVQALYQVPLSDTRVGFWVNLLLEAMAENFPFETTARMLVHPLGPGLLDKQWARAREVRPREAKAWEEIGADLSRLAWPEEDTRARWMERFDTLLEAHTLQRKVTSWPREVLALTNLKEAVEWLKEPAEETISRQHFLQELNEVLRTATTPVHLERKGVALHTPLSLYGARYPYVFVLGLVEGVFPPLVADDPALDFHERKRLRNEGIHLELADERARRERLSFWTLLRVPQERLVLCKWSLTVPLHIPNISWLC